MAIRRFHWDVVDDCVMHETNENGDTLVTYTHEPGPFGPLLSENRDGVESYHHYDALGSTTMLTDDTGAVTDTFQYDAWGNDVARTGSTPTPYTWCGRWGYQFDSPIGGYYVRERSYDPAVARWRSVDPLFSYIQIWDQFIYAGNRPLILLDATGMLPVIILLPPAIFCNTPKSPCEGKSETQICDPKFLADNKVDTGDGGGIVCCNGKAYPCVFKIRGQPDPGECKDRDDCILIHERYHIKTGSKDCDATKLEPYRLPWSEKQKEGGFTTANECNARASSVTCLCGRLKKPTKDDGKDCKASMRWLLAKMIEYVMDTVDGKPQCSDANRKKVVKAINVDKCPFKG